MYISNAKIQNYRQLHHCEVAFYNSLNILVGDNEAGKSTPP